LKYEPDYDFKPSEEKDYHSSSVGIKEDMKPDSPCQGDATLPAIYIVNMQALVKTLMRIDQTGPSVPATALRMNMPANPRLPCAGNECQ